VHSIAVGFENLIIELLVVYGVWHKEKDVRK
jgi:hypothetical protein